MVRSTDQRIQMRAMLFGTQCLSPATVYDALSARIAESIGFKLGVLSGSVTAATTLAAPDLALQTLTEFSDQVRRIMRFSNLSLMADADHGYGNALNVIRTVQELEHAGVSAIAIEDVAQPDRFGEQKGKPLLVSTEEMVGKLRAAVSARQDPSLVIVGRVAALKVEDVHCTVTRAKAYAGTGVDAIFITGLKKLADFDAIRAAITLPIVLGSTPDIRREDLAERGVRILIQGHQPIAAVAKALHVTYSHLFNGGAPSDLQPKLAKLEEMDFYLNVEKFREMKRDYLG